MKGTLVNFRLDADAIHKLEKCATAEKRSRSAMAKIIFEEGQERREKFKDHRPEIIPEAVVE